jgi:uncharacterized protein (TIGR02996 family)
MHSEEDFQAALDASPADWQIRLVFADWLQEEGDPRAEAYRTLGNLRITPDMNFKIRYSCVSDDRWHRNMEDRSVLPQSWYYMMPTIPSEGGKYCMARLRHDETRYIAETKVVTAFMELSDYTKQEILFKAPPPSLYTTSHAEKYKNKNVLVNVQDGRLNRSYIGIITETTSSTITINKFLVIYNENIRLIRIHNG